MAEILEEERESSQAGTLEEPDYSSCQWFFAQEFIESSSPSRQDGIDAAKEAYLRNSYCTFLQDLGMRLKVPQLTIATAIVFCHRFFLRQSHAKNDRYIIATVCMFLAGKVEESPKLLQNVISFAYEIRHKKNPEHVHRIKIKEVYEQEKELILVGERLVLSTLEFDLNIHHPYKPLVTAIKKLKVAQNALAQVAWNFINDGLRTSLCLQFKAHHIAAGAIFLAAKFLKVKLPSNGKKPWWQEFNVTPRQLEDVSNQMLELYERNRDTSASRPADPSGLTNYDTKGTHTLHPSTPQVAEKRSSVEDKAKTVAESSQQPQNLGDSKTSLTELEQMNIEKLKTAVQKKRKLKSEGGGTKSKQELTDEEELLEKGMENGHRNHQQDDASNVYNTTDMLTHQLRTGAGASKPNIHAEMTEDDLEIDNVESFSENRQWPSHGREHSQTSQIRQTNEPDLHHHRQKSREWKEREHKRLCQ